jgi:hypothetical protein
MYIVLYLRISAAVLLPIIIGSCVTAFSEPAVPPAPKDYSFPTSGNIIETDLIYSVIQDHWRNTRSRPSGGVSMIGHLRNHQSFSHWIFIRELKNQGALEKRFILPSWKMQYTWDGSIFMDNTLIQTRIDIDAYGPKSGGGKHYILQNVSIEPMRLVCEDPFEIYTGYSDFPFLLGYVVTKTENFRMYAVLDNEPDELNIYRNGVFFHPLQKIQFLDEQNTVAAEIQENRYTLYDTIPQSEIRAIKYAVALLAVFRHTAQVLTSLGNTWDIPQFYRYDIHDRK